MRWPWVLLGLALAALAAGGVTVLVTLVRHHRIVTAVPVAAGLRRSGADAQRTADTLLAAVVSAAGRDPVAVAYGAPGDPPLLVVGGRLGAFDDGATALRSITRTFAVSAFRSGTGPVRFADQPAGPLGGLTRCASVRVGAAPSAVCGWSDRDTVGIAVSPVRTQEQLAALLGRARVDLER